MRAIDGKHTETIRPGFDCPVSRMHFRKKILLTFIRGIIFSGGILMGALAILPAWASEEYQMQCRNLKEDKVAPSCEELKPSQEQIDSAVAEAMVGLDNPWGNASDFQVLLDRIEAILGCSLQKDQLPVQRTPKSSRNLDSRLPRNDERLFRNYSYLFNENYTFSNNSLKKFTNRI
jgi:hypothetical protein